MNRTSDYIDYDKALNKGLSLLKDEKKSVIGFFIVFSINTGLRVSDTLQIKHKHLAEDDKIIFTEKKTNKQRELTLNNIVKKSYEMLCLSLEKAGKHFGQDDFVFVSQKGSVYKTQSINTILKETFNIKKLQISSHSLRKSFARRVYENQNESENSLILLSEIFGHSSVAITRKYLGIRRETISNIYLSLA
jgi:site-specific recombinase XerD